MDITSLINTLRSTPGCKVYPPAGLPIIREEHILPDDVRAFYQLCGGVTLFEDADFSTEIVSPQFVTLANPVNYLGLCLPREQLDEMSDDISWSWYVIADLCNHNFLTIDYSRERLGHCYDSHWEVHPRDSAIIATSFTELLVHLLAVQGETEWYWDKPGFKALGSPYD